MSDSIMDMFHAVEREQPFYDKSTEEGFIKPVPVGGPNFDPPKAELSLPSNATELTITIKDSEKTQKTKHLVYENYFLNDQDPVIKALIAQALQEFNAEPEAIRIRVSLEVL